jgi:hypothetical protein
MSARAATWWSAGLCLHWASGPESWLRRLPRSSVCPSLWSPRSWQLTYFPPHGGRCCSNALPRRTLTSCAVIAPIDRDRVTLALQRPKESSSCFFRVPEWFAFVAVADYPNSPLFTPHNCLASPPCSESFSAIARKNLLASTPSAPPT